MTQLEELPSDVIVECLERSEKFRKFIAEKISGLSPFSVRRIVEDKMAEFKRANAKIAAIKWIRDFSSKSPENARALDSEWPGCGFAQTSWGTSTMGLADAKHFAEKFIP